MRFVRLALAALLVLTATACISLKSYPDPQFHKATYESVGKFHAVTPVRLEVVFQRNGKDLPRAVKQVQPMIEKTLLASGAFSFTTDAAAPLLRVTLNNVADMNEAAKKGFVTGLTFGGKGSTVDDFYEAKIEFVVDGTPVVKNYKHVLHSTIGNAAAPVQGMAPMTPTAAFGVVVEDIMLNFVKDLKDDGKISERTVHFDTFVAVR